ncbi:thiamine pyrophosphate-binding protein [Thermoactinospora rubra]|uniref:thiamine pyrophosphate-binding protein n=1 Tax=Thermoactinospora rubra TaxID=1088767 RepID=UPI000A0F84D3|nr:thiamine pyrophosphate-binding protein [Thermoactinospora rubra]
MNVAEAVGRVVARLGVERAFGVVGSGNFHLANGMAAGGVRFVAARHEGGAATMADAFARMTGGLGVLTVHQGPGLTNAMTGIAEAAKSRTPLLVLAGEAREPRSNFHIDQAGLAAAVDAVPMRVGGAETAVEETIEAYRTAWYESRPVLLNLPLDVQRERAPDGGSRQEFLDLIVDSARAAARSRHEGGPGRPEAVADLVRLLLRARRPVFVAGRGALHARRELEDLADSRGALLATSAVAKGLFRGSPWDLDVCGGFASPLAASLISTADLVVAWGCSLTMWTTRHGTIFGPYARVVQVDRDPAALGAHVPLALGIVGDAAAVASAAAQALLDARLLGEEDQGPGYRSPELAERIAREVRWRDVPYEDESRDGRIDPRTLTIALDDLLPGERVVCPDSGNFMGYPAMFMDVPDERGFCFTQGFQSIGLGLSTAIGAALARPDRLPVAALGDGGALMGISELETVVRLGLPMVIVVYDDEGYGAEVHHFHGEPHDLVTFPPTDFAEIGRGYGCAAVTVTAPDHLKAVEDWVGGPRDRPLLVHAKVTRDHGSWWLEEAFKGH